MHELLSQSVVALSAMLRRKEVSAREAVDVHLQRINAVNPQLNAVVQLAADRARQEAAAADEALAQGEDVGPLHGVPMTIKDSLDTAGIISTGGTQGREHYVPSQDATVVARLRQAGAILLGKTNTPELTLSFDTDNLIYGPTHNPHNTALSPGGSSGGAAAIVAVHGAPFDIGSDFGGSIRLPTHFCGIAGIKPTSGRVPRTGHIYPFGGYLDHLQQLGPLARSVVDLFPLLAIIAGPDGHDPATVPMPLRDPGDVQLQDLRVAFHTDNGIARPTPETSVTVQHAAGLLEKARCRVVESRPAGLSRLADVAPAMYFSDGGAAAQRLLREYGTVHPSLPYLDTQDTPSITEVDTQIAKWDQYRAAMQPVWDDYDAILCPVNASPSMPPGQYMEQIDAFTYTMAYNLTGWPSAVVRCGTADSGLPIGVQVVTAPWREDIALALALYLEQSTQKWASPIS